MNVLIVFQSRLGSTERLALAAAVGAVQGRAKIRLRRLDDGASTAQIARSPEWQENEKRMSREYVAPRPADADWAEAILVGMPAEFTSLSPEFRNYFDLLRVQGNVKARFGAVFTPNTDSLEQGLVALGLAVVPFESQAEAREAARLQGRRVAEAIADRVS